MKASKKQGGRVYIEPTHTGEVRFHGGYITQSEATKEGKKAKAIVEDGEEDAALAHHQDDAELSHLHRHAAVRLAVIARPTDALPLLIAHAVAARVNWRVLPDARRPDSKAVEESVSISPAPRRGDEPQHCGISLFDEQSHI